MSKETLIWLIPGTPLAGISDFIRPASSESWLPLKGFPESTAFPHDLTSEEPAPARTHRVNSPDRPPLATT